MARDIATHAEEAKEVPPSRSFLSDQNISSAALAVPGKHLPPAIKEFVANHSHFDTSSRLREKFWEWYPGALHKAGLDENLGALPPQLRKQIEAKLVNAWENARRAIVVDKDVVLRVKGLKPHVVCKRSWDLFKERFRQCYDDDPSDPKTLASVRKFFLARFDTQEDFDLLNWCKTQLSKDFY